MQARFSRALEWTIVALLVIVIASCVAQNCYASTMTLTFPFAGANVPPDGTLFVVDTPVASYPCSVLAAKCVVMPLASDFTFTQAACIYPKAQPDGRTCFYWLSISVKESKRRAVRH